MNLSMLRARFGALVASRGAGSPWIKPALRVTLAAAALVALAAIGRCASSETVHAATAIATVEPALSAALIVPEIASGAPASAPSASSDSAAEAPSVAPSRHGPASPEDPVVLNQATPEDLQRLPGIGAKRATAIVALRSKLGRFRQVEDLLRVRGIGRATLKRLRPLVRLDPPPQPDAGAT